MNVLVELDGSIISNAAWRLRKKIPRILSTGPIGEMDFL